MASILRKGKTKVRNWEEGGGATATTTATALAAPNSLSQVPKKKVRFNPSALEPEGQVGGLYVTGEVVTRHLYPVEKILNRRFKHGRVEYLVAWDGFGPEDNTWEPADNVTSRELIEEFEEEHGLCSIEAIPVEQEKETANSLSTDTNKMNDASTKNTINGFDLGFEPQQIIGVSKSISGELIYRVKWKEMDESTLVPARVVDSKWPEGVLSFYEYRLAWPTPEETDDN